MKVSENMDTAITEIIGAVAKGKSKQQRIRHLRKAVDVLQDAEQQFITGEGDDIS